MTVLVARHPPSGVAARTASELLVRPELAQEQVVARSPRAARPVRLPVQVVVEPRRVLRERVQAHRVSVAAVARPALRVPVAAQRVQGRALPALVVVR